MLQGHISFLPGRFPSFEASAARHFSHEINRMHVVHFHLEDRLHCRLNFRLCRSPVNPEGQQLPRVLRFFFRNQRLLGNHWRLNDVPNRSHSWAPPSSAWLSWLSLSAGSAASTFGFRVRLGFAGAASMGAASTFSSGEASPLIRSPASASFFGPRSCSSSSTADLEMINFS